MYRYLMITLLSLGIWHSSQAQPLPEPTQAAKLKAIDKYAEKIGQYRYLKPLDDFRKLLREIEEEGYAKSPKIQEAVFHWIRWVKVHEEKLELPAITILPLLEPHSSICMPYFGGGLATTEIPDFEQERRDYAEKNQRRYDESLALMNTVRTEFEADFASAMAKKLAAMHHGRMLAVPELAIEFLHEHKFTHPDFFKILKDLRNAKSSALLVIIDPNYGYDHVWYDYNVDRGNKVVKKRNPGYEKAEPDDNRSVLVLKNIDPSGLALRAKDLLKSIPAASPEAVIAEILKDSLAKNRAEKLGQLIHEEKVPEVWEKALKAPVDQKSQEAADQLLELSYETTGDKRKAIQAARKAK